MDGWGMIEGLPGAIRGGVTMRRGSREPVGHESLLRARRTPPSSSSLGPRRLPVAGMAVRDEARSVDRRNSAKHSLSVARCVTSS